MGEHTERNGVVLLQSGIQKYADAAHAFGVLLLIDCEARAPNFVDFDQQVRHFVDTCKCARRQPAREEALDFVIRTLRQLHYAVRGQMRVKGRTDGRHNA
jgi:hypothetical protein